MSNKLESDKPDYIRDLLSWLILAIVILILLFSKPTVAVRESTMYLPKITDLTAIDKEKVKIITEKHFNNYFLYNKVGSITITVPYMPDRRSELQYNVIDHARDIAAGAGADKLLVEYMVTSPWFDTGKTVFRMQAIALKQ